jgi:TorA maturation chaperone TorD
MTTSEAVDVRLAARQCMYSLLHHLFGTEPTKELLELAVSENIRLVIALYQDQIPDDDAESSFPACLDRLEKNLQQREAATLDAVGEEYMRLMVGPRALVAPPWESVYVGRDGTLFQDVTLQVRETYRKQGLLPEHYPHEADDHLALELHYMEHMAGLSMEAADAEGEADAAVSEGAKSAEGADDAGGAVETEGSEYALLKDQLDFLNDHLLRWVDEFAKGIQRSKTHYLYPQAALFLAEFLHQDAAYLNGALQARA